MVSCHFHLWPPCLIRRQAWLVAVWSLGALPVTLVFWIRRSKARLPGVRAHREGDSDFVGWWTGMGTNSVVRIRVPCSCLPAVVPGGLAERARWYINIHVSITNPQMNFKKRKIHTRKLEY